MASIRIAIADAGTIGRPGMDSIAPGARKRRRIQFDATEEIGTPDLVHMKGRI